MGMGYCLCVMSRPDEHFADSVKTPSLVPCKKKNSSKLIFKLSLHQEEPLRLFTQMFLPNCLPKVILAFQGSLLINSKMQQQKYF